MSTSATARDVRWMMSDCRDDFFPDPVRFADLGDFDPIKLIRSKDEQSLALDVPKDSLFQRHSVWMAPADRLAYLSLTRQFLEPLRPTLSENCYSYRPAESQNVPFPSPAKDWLRFQNDYRSTLASSGHWGVQTDIVSYFDHIETDALLTYIERALPSGRKTRQTLARLGKSIRLLTSKTLPPNNEASSFLASAFLADVDRALSSRRGIKYFRYQDDIRLVAATKEAVVAAFLELQTLLRSKRLFLNTTA